MYSFITTNMTLNMQECDMIRKQLDNELRLLRNIKEEYGEEHAVEIPLYEKLIDKIKKAQHRMTDNKVTGFDTITDMDKERLADFLTNVSCAACGKWCDRYAELKQSYIEFLDNEETEGDIAMFKVKCKTDE